MRPRLLSRAASRLLAGLLLTALGGCSLVPSLSVTPRYGRLAPEGDVLVSSVGASASSDVDALGLDEEDVLSPRADLAWGPLDVMASGFATEYEGRGRAEGQLDLGGVIINQGDTVDSRLDLSLASVVATFDLVPTGLVDVGIGIGAAYVDFDARVESVTTGMEVGSAEQLVIPVVAARVGSRLGPLEVSLHASGLSGSYGGVDATFADVDLYAKYSFEELLAFHAAIGVGYRMILLDVEYEEQGSDVQADLELSGLYLGLTVGI